MNWIAVFNASPSLQPEVRATVLIAGVLMLAGLPLNLAGKVFAGYQELHTYNKTYRRWRGEQCCWIGRWHLASCLYADSVPVLVWKHYVGCSRDDALARTVAQAVA